MATFDAHATLARATVVTAPAPALTGLSLVVGAGEGAVFPAAPFNCTIYPSDQVPTLANAEVVRVTAVVGDTLTIVRAQEGTTAKAVAAGYYISNSVTVKVFTDIENAINANIQSISAGAGVATSNLIIFSNANGVSFGANADSVITASVAAGGGGAAISAGAESQSTGTVVFSASNGVTFGLSNNGVMTASHNGLTAQTTQPVAASASNGSFAFSTLAFGDANNVTFGTSAGGIITASVAAGGGGGSVNFSAGTQSANLASIVFSNSNGVSFGLSNGTITASASGGGGGGGVTLSAFTYPPFNNSVGRAISNTSSNFYAVAMILPQAVSLNYVRFIGIMLNGQSNLATLNSASAEATNQMLQTHYALIYSMGTGASSQSLMFVASGSGGFTYQNQISITNSSQATVTVGVTAPLSGGSTFSETQFSISSANYAFSTNAIGSLFASTRMIDVPLNTVLPAGNYWVLSANQTATAFTGPAGLAAMSNNRIYMNSGYFAGDQLNAQVLVMGQETSNPQIALLGAGSYNNAGGSTSEFNVTEIKTAVSNIAPYFQMLCSQ